MTGEKIRIYELAKQLQLPNKEVIDTLEDKMKISVKSHASTIDKGVADQLTKYLTSPKTPPSEQKPAQPAVQKPAVKEPSAEQRPAQPVEKQQQFVEKQAPQQPSENRPQGQFPRRDGQPYQQRQDGQQGQFPRQDRPQGQFPRRDGQPYQQRQDGQQGQFQRQDRPQGQFPRRDGQPYQQRQDGQQGQFPRQDRPQGQFPRRDGQPYQQRQDGQQGQFQRQDRPQGQFPRRDGQPYQQRQDGQQGQFQRQDSLKGQKVFVSDMKRGDRPQGQFPRRDGQPQQGAPRPFGPPGERKFEPRPFGGPKKPGGAAPVPEADLGKSAGRREAFGKKKDRSKEELYTKEEKLEQKKVLQDAFKKKKKSQEEIKEVITEVVIDKPLTVGELAAKLGLGAAEVVKELMMSGILATVNQTIDCCAAKNVAEKLEFTVLDTAAVAVCPIPGMEEGETPTVAAEEEKEDTSGFPQRAPVVTIMGHVDHGKTTLLDAIRNRKHKIVSSEVGGITQSIGAYSVKVNDKKIVFIDTPGHEAFTAMRARGAQATDIAILVVAADDGIMPQTIEAISHAKAAKVPIIVAVNKIDKPGADPDRVLQQLTEYELVPEKWGGDTITVEVSALQGLNLDELLEYILLVSEVEDLRAEPNKNATGVIIEAKLDKGKGAVATLLVQAGTLKVGDFVVAGSVGGKIRALISDEGERLKEAGPSTPVEILGLTEVPQSGDKFEIVDTDKEMKNIIEARKDEERTSRLEAISPSQVRTETILGSPEESLEKDLNIIIKANTHGSAEAVSASLQQLKSKQIYVKVVHIGVGDISEADVMLAAASNAMLLGFSVKEDQNALRLASAHNVDIRKYDIIYHMLEDIEKAMLGLLTPETKEVEIGTAEVRQVFTVGKVSKIAGCYVTDGKIIRNKVAKVFRGNKEIYTGPVDQLKRFKDDVKEVATNYECGISFNKFNDIEEGDIIKVFTTEEIERDSLV